MASSSSQEFFGNCPQCSKMDVKIFHCPTLAGRGQHYLNLPGMPLHSHFTSRSPNQCCPAALPTYPSFPIRFNSFSHCSRSRTTNVEHSLVMSPHMRVNSCWLSPMEIHHTNLTTNISANPLHQRGIPRRHVGMATIAQLDGLTPNCMSLYHHRHFHHYHHHTQSRINVHPYASALQPRFHRQAAHISRNSEENPDPNFIPVMTSETQLPWERLETRQIENVVNLEDLIVDEKPRGISKSVLDSLPTYRVASKVKNVCESHCVICLMEFEQKQQIRILPCLHEYHSKCIDKWLKGSRSCPICRKEVKAVD
ncbi:uncharacterized protein LOC114516153 [Dendronephthya gigantea]|uniref:uncharacterized protein LOC114516153 n=1 Tax=Dendronephthya gigantea TaxID=151771 RepID=UPI00106C171B|nr:uncharacterized protein LOC114516153 [Dendronephthya gigantea]